MTREQLEQMLAEVRSKRDKAYEEYQQYHGAMQLLTHLLTVLVQEQPSNGDKEAPLYEITD